MSCVLHLANLECPINYQSLLASVVNLSFGWTEFSPFMQLFVECIEELQGENPLKVNIALLLGTAALERALGDVQ